MKNKKKSRESHSLAIVRNFFPKVEKVVDSNKAIIVEVTPHDVKVASVKRHKTCALAVACQRTFRADGIIIGITTAYVIKGTVATRHKLGTSIGREITSFDRGAKYEIGFYQLTPISPSSRLGTKRSDNPNRPQGKKNGTRRFMHYTEGVRTSLNRLPEEGN